MLYKNVCHDCGCNCTCNHDCGGDYKKCSSEGAKTKKCNHHCGCYIGPWADTLPPIRIKKKKK